MQVTKNTFIVNPWGIFMITIVLDKSWCHYKQISSHYKQRCKHPVITKKDTNVQSNLCHRVYAFCIDGMLIIKVVHQHTNLVIARKAATDSANYWGRFIQLFDSFSTFVSTKTCLWKMFKIEYITRDSQHFCMTAQCDTSINFSPWEQHQQRLISTYKSTLCTVWSKKWCVNIKHLETLFWLEHSTTCEAQVSPWWKLPCQSKYLSRSSFTQTLWDMVKCIPLLHTFVCHTKITVNYSTPPALFWQSGCITKNWKLSRQETTHVATWNF